jgi:hypothetical protein
MVDFVNETRKRCRNPKCRSKLTTPVSNSREAFCARGCHSSFYRIHCRVCEAHIEQPKGGGERFICKKSACFNAWNANSGFGCYPSLTKCQSDLRNTNKTGGGQKPHKPDRAWRIMAGPELTPGQFRAATVPDGSNCQWKGGSFDRIEAQNRRELALLKRWR